jgi:hypothetical protein
MDWPGRVLVEYPSSAKGNDHLGLFSRPTPPVVDYLSGKRYGVRGFQAVNKGGWPLGFIEFFALGGYVSCWIGLLDIRNGTAAKICSAVNAGVR